MGIGFKVVSVGAGLGVASGGSGLIYWYSLPNSLRTELINSKKVPLSTVREQDKEEWKKLIKKYAGNNPTPKLGELKITLESSGEPRDKDIEDMQTECEKLFNKKKGDKDFDKDLERATAWCIKNSAKLNESTTTSPSRVNGGGPLPSADSNPSRSGDSVTT